MTTIYNIRGTHPTAPNTITLLAFSEEERDEKAMGLLKMIVQDIDYADEVAMPDKQWETLLRGLQIVMIGRKEGNTPQATAANYANDPDVIPQRAGFDVWVEEHDVAIPSNIPGRLPETIEVWSVASDDKNGTNSDIMASEEDAIQWLCEAVESDVETFEQWQKDNPDGPDKFHDNDIFGYLSEKADSLSTYNYHSVELPIADLLGTLPIPDIAVILDGGLVQNVCSRDGQPVRLTVVDYDTEGADEDDLTAIVQDDGKKADAYLSQGGYYHDTSADEVFWQRIVGKPLTQPQHRTVWASVIVDETPEPRVSLFRTQADRRADLIDFYAESADAEDPKGDDDASETDIARVIEDHIAGVHSVKLIRTAMAEG